MASLFLARSTKRAVCLDGVASGLKPRRTARAVCLDGSAGGPKPRRTTRALSISLVTAVWLASGCGKPTEKPAPPPAEEKWAVVTSDKAPLIRKLTATADALDVLNKGELVKIQREAKTHQWSSKLEGVEARREGMTLEVKFAEEGPPFYAFLPDLGAETSIPVTSFLCSSIGTESKLDVSQCPMMLRRAKAADGALLFYMPCSTGPCPAGFLREGKVGVIAVDNLISVRFFQGAKQSLLLASTRWIKADGKQSGGVLVPLLYDGKTLAPRPEIALDQVDARDPAKLLSRTVRVVVTATQVTMTGEQEVKSEDGTVLSKVPIDEKVALPALD